jgi:hypothetical protein
MSDASNMPGIFASMSDASSLQEFTGNAQVSCLHCCKQSKHAFASIQRTPQHIMLKHCTAVACSSRRSLGAATVAAGALPSLDSGLARSVPLQGRYMHTAALLKCGNMAHTTHSNTIPRSKQGVRRELTPAAKLGDAGLLRVK